MDILKTIDEILRYYDSTRRVGHTHLIFNGTSGIPNITVASSQESKSNLMREYPLFPDEVITLSSIENQKLRGIKRPIAFDNHAIYTLLYSARDRIKELEAENKRLEDTKFHMTIKYEEKPKEKKIVAFRRISDNELFTLNDDLVTFSNEIMKRQFPKHLHMKWSKDALLNGPPSYCYQTRAFIPIYED